jgi:drug/metabolite transporter (DMT)-like permease
MNNKSLTAIAVAIILWASAFVGIRAGLYEYSPEGLALLRYLVASVVMGFIYWRHSEPSQLGLADKLGLLLVGVIGIGVYNLTLNHGEVSVSSGVASFITNQSPIITAIFAVLFLGETLNAQRICGFTVSLLGIALIAYGEIGSFELSPGILYVMCAMVAGSCFSVMQKPFLKKCHPIEATTYVVWGGTLFLLSFYPQMHHDVMHASLHATLVVVYLGIFPASLAYIAWSYVLRDAVALTQAVSYMYIMPFMAALMGWVLLGEAPAIIAVVGALLAIAGVWLVNRSFTANTDDEIPELEVDAVTDV